MIKTKLNDFLTSKPFEMSILTLIFFNIIMFIIQTDVNISNRFNTIFSKFELVSVVIFTIEYLLRLLVIKNIKEVFGFYMLIDFCAIAPFYLSFLPVNAISLRFFRLFRLFRILKITRYTNAFHNLKSAFTNRKNELIIIAVTFITAVIISSTMMYFAEAGHGQEGFNSIPSAFWWSIVTFTTVGYGDTYPVTTTGKAIASLCAIFGVGLHGLLIGVIGTALMETIQNNAEDNQ